MGQKRGQDSSFTSSARPVKATRAYEPSRAGLSKAEIEALIDRKVDEKIAEKALNEKIAPAQALPNELQSRLNALEQRVAEKEDSEGLQFLLMAKQHHARGEDASALRMYQFAQPFFPNNEKLARKIDALREKMRRKQDAPDVESISHAHVMPKKLHDDPRDGDYREHYEPAEEAEDSFVFKPKKKSAPKMKVSVFRDDSLPIEPPSPRTQQLIDIINSRDVAQIRALKGVGTKKAEAIVSSLCEMDGGEDNAFITDLFQLGGLKGVGVKTVENMRMGLAFAV